MKCDPFNLRDVERALAGAQTAYYPLGESSSRWTQGRTADLDLLCADTLARAARTTGVQNIVCAESPPEEVIRTFELHGVPWVVAPGAAPAVSPTTRWGARSVQRLPLPRGRDASWVAAEYARWLPRFMRPFLRVEVDESRTCRFYLRPLRTPLLVLTFAADRSSPDRQLFYVTGGLLSGAPNPKNRPRLEFRSVLDRTVVLSAVHDFNPRLPWLIYRLTQAPVHLLVMNGFARHLARTESLQVSG